MFRQIIILAILTCGVFSAIDVNTNISAGGIITAGNTAANDACTKQSAGRASCPMKNFNYEEPGYGKVNYVCCYHFIELLGLGACQLYTVVDNTKSKELDFDVLGIKTFCTNSLIQKTMIAAVIFVSAFLF